MYSTVYNPVPPCVCVGGHQHGIDQGEQNWSRWNSECASAQCCADFLQGQWMAHGTKEGYVHIVAAFAFPSVSKPRHWLHNLLLHLLPGWCQPLKHECGWQTQKVCWSKGPPPSSSPGGAQPAASSVAWIMSAIETLVWMTNTKSLLI